MVKFIGKNTRAGVKYLMFGLAALGLSEIFSAMLLGGMSTAIRQESIDEGILCFACFGMLVGLAALLLLAIGTYNLYKDSSRVSTSHSTKVKIGGLLLIITVIFGRLWSSITGMGEADDFFANVRTLGISAGLAGTISTVIFVSALLLLIYEISREKYRNYMYGIFVVYVLINLIFVWWFATISTTGDEAEIAASFIDRVAVTQFVEGLFSFTFAGIYFAILGDLDKKRRDQREEQSTEITETLNECPGCGEEKMSITLDGSGFCKGCEKTVKSYYKEMEEETAPSSEEES